MKELRIVNIKKLEDKSFEFPDSGAVVVLGGNDTGKSTVIQCIQNILLAKNFIPNPVTTGKEEGSIEYTGKDINGNAVVIRMDIQKDGTSNVSCVYYDEEGKKNRKMSNLKEIRSLLGDYFPLNVHQVFSMLKYAEGRREFFDKYISKLLSEEALKRIAYIDREVSTKESIQTRGNLFFVRRDAANKEKELQAIISSSVSLEKPEYSVGDLKDAQKTANAKYVEIEGLKSKNSLIKWGIDKYKAFFNLADANSEDFESLYKNLGIEEDPGFKSLKNWAQQEWLRLEAFLVDEAEINTQKEEWQRKLNKITSLLATWDSYDQMMASLEDKKKELKKVNKEVADLTRQIEELRQERIGIISSSNLPEGMTIDEEYNFYVNGVLFHDASISETMARLYIILLLLHISGGTFIDIGDWSLYDESNKTRISKLAKKFNCLMMGQYVTNDDDVSVKVIDG